MCYVVCQGGNLLWATRHKLQLTDEQTQILRQLRDTGQPAYLRERAGALLKIAAGQSPHKVARSGLLKPRKPDTLYAWLRRYREHGVQGLRHKPGKGRSPAFAPLSKEDAEVELQHFILRDPAQIPPHETRWTLRTLSASVPWLNGLSIPAVHQTLDRLGISYKRGRTYVHSPDIEYNQKLACVQQALATAKRHPETNVAFYQDEFAFHLQPTLGKDWTQTATKKPLARQNLDSDEVCYGMGGPQRTHRRSGLSPNRKGDCGRNPCVLRANLSAISECRADIFDSGQSACSLAPKPISSVDTTDVVVSKATPTELGGQVFKENRQTRQVADRDCTTADVCVLDQSNRETLAMGASGCFTSTSAC